MFSFRRRFVPWTGALSLGPAGHSALSLDACYRFALRTHYVAPNTGSGSANKQWLQCNCQFCFFFNFNCLYLIMYSVWLLVKKSVLFSNLIWTTKRFYMECELRSVCWHFQQTSMLLSTCTMCQRCVVHCHIVKITNGWWR